MFRFLASGADGHYFLPGAPLFALSRIDEAKQQKLFVQKEGKPFPK
jgi:hypothetical protein